MKRLFILLSLLFAGFAFADTINLHWLNYDGTSYQDSTCVVDSDLILPSTTPTRYGYTFTGWKISNYIPIEYLESTGTQWIDTGLKGGLDYFYFDIKFSASFNNNSQYYIIGNFNQTGQSGIMFSTANHNNIVFVYYVSGTNYEHKIGVVNDILQISKRDNIVHCNENIFEVPSNTSKLRNSNLCLWGTCVGTPFNAFGKMYYLKIWDNNTLVRDFIPVLDENGTPCLYDRVTEEFYYNQGTGNFIAGPVVDE